MPSLCNQQLQKLSFLFLQTLHNDCSHIEDVHHLFCAHLINIFSFFTVVGLRFFPSKMRGVSLVCVICNFNSFQSFIAKRRTMIVHTLKMCTFYFMHVSFYFLILTGVELRHFSIRNAKGVPSLCNLKLKQYSFFYFQTLHNDCSHI